MRVLSQAGSTAFLIELAEGQGAVLDITAEPTLSQVMSVETLLGAGPWELFAGDSVRIAELVHLILSEGVELPSQGFDVRGASRRLIDVQIDPANLQPPLMEVLTTPLRFNYHGGTFDSATWSWTSQPSETAGAR